MLTPSDLDTVHELLTQSFHVTAQVLTGVQLRRELIDILSSVDATRFEADWLKQLNTVTRNDATVRRILERSLKR